MTYRPPCTALADFEDLAGPSARWDGMMPGGALPRRVPVKWWEYNFLARSMEECVGFDGKARALGLGVGMEPLIFYFARGCRDVLATDLYSADSEWPSARLADPSFVRSLAPFDYDAARLRIESADMRNVPVPDGDVDFVWSCSSIEHVPSLRDLYTTFREIHRVLKPGGYALLTTGYCLPPGPYLMRCQNYMDPDLFGRFVGGLGGLELAGPVNLQYNWGCPANHSRPRQYLPPGLQRPDKPLREIEGPQVAEYVGISQITALGFVLRKAGDGRGLRPWEDLDLPPEIRDFSDMLDAMGRGDSTAAVRIGRPYCETSRGDELPLQFRLQWMRFFLEATARTRNVSTSRHLGPWLDRMAAMIPAGAMQDADCFDLHTLLCGKVRKYDLALEVLPRIIRSPSTLGTHALGLACRLLTYGHRAGRFDLALDTLRAEWADLASNASVTPDAVASFLAALSGADLPGPQAEQAASAVREALAPYPRYLEMFDRLRAGAKVPPGRLLRRLKRWLGPSGVLGFVHRRSKRGHP